MVSLPPLELQITIANGMFHYPLWKTFLSLLWKVKPNLSSYEQQINLYK